MNVYVTQQGLEKLRGELAEILERLDAVKKEKALAYTASGDNWHDNPHFNKLQQDEEGIARRVAELQRIISQAQVVPIASRNVRQVRLGSIVCFYRRRGASKERTLETWEIVGYGETDTNAKKVAYNSPLATALLGKEPGDIAEGEVDKEHIEYEIVALFPSWEAANS